MDPTVSLLALIAFFVGLGGLVWLAWGKGPAHHPVGGLFALIGFGILTVVLLFPAAFSGTSGNSTPLAAGGTFNNVFGTTPALPTGCTFYQSQDNVACTVVFNSTTDYLAIQASVAATFQKPIYIDLPFNLIRTDNANTTFTESTTLSTVPTFNSLGSSPQTYSPLGFKSATSATPGQWQVYADQGTQANQKPTASAPSTSSNVLSTSVPVKAFSSQTVGWHLTLAGSNSTSFPATAAQAWANNTNEVFTFSFGGGSGSTGFESFTLTLDLLGWHA